MLHNQLFVVQNQLESQILKVACKHKKADGKAFNWRIAKCFFINCLKNFSRYAFDDIEKLCQIENAIDSDLQTIEFGAFSDTSIESFTISSNLIDLQDGWCLNLRKLINVIVSKDNPKYSIYDDKMIIWKSSLKADNCDSVVFLL